MGWFPSCAPTARGSLNPKPVCMRWVLKAQPRLCYWVEGPLPGSFPSETPPLTHALPPPGPIFLVFLARKMAFLSQGGHCHCCVGLRSEGAPGPPAEKRAGDVLLPECSALSLCRSRPCLVTGGGAGCPRGHRGLGGTSFPLLYSPGPHRAKLAPHSHCILSLSGSFL